MRPHLFSSPSEDGTDTGADDRTSSILANTIQAVNVAEALVPLELAKGVLSSISSILELIKTGIDNKRDFLQIAEQCNKISLMLCQATVGRPENDTNPVLDNAINELQSCVDEMLEAVQVKIQSHIGSRLFHASVDKDRIAGWQQDLDRFLLMFNTQLSISSNITVESLMARFDELKDILQIKGEPTVPTIVPPKPPVFVGRSEIVQVIVDRVLDLQNVALIATGGMGKTYIARAILHQPKIVNKFGQRRFFVQYDDIDASQITLATFLTRLSRRLGISASRENIFPLINIFLASEAQPTLIVLDNAETFVDEGPDSGRIADCINDLGALPNVAILATSRSTTLPSNLIWERYHVLPLEDAAAHELFCRTYKSSLTPDLASLIRKLDNHPLSINLLAQAAVQNEWSPEELRDAWKRGHTSLLDTGLGRSQSLAVTINFTLQSPSILKYGEVVHRIIQTVAFFPQGVKRKSLEEIFSDTSEASQVIDTLNRHSLTHSKQEFITMLAPIRLHFVSETPPGSNNIPIPDEVYHFYLTRLAAPAMDTEDIHWISSEDINIERLFSVCLRHCLPRDFTDIAKACATFLEILADNKPRPTSLQKVIPNLDYSDVGPTGILHSTNRRTSRRNMFYKGRCILSLALLLLAMGEVYESGNLVEEGIELVHRSGLAVRSGLQLLPLMVAVSYLQTGNFPSAEETLNLMVQKFSKVKYHISSKDTVWTCAPVMLECVQITLGKKNTSGNLLKLLKKLKYNSKDETEHYGLPHAIRILTFAIPWLPGPEYGSIGKEHCAKLVGMSYLPCRFAGLILSANTALREGSLSAAEELLQEARPLRKLAELEDRISYYQLLAAYRVKSGLYDDARAAIRSLTKVTFLGKLMASTVVPYMNGWIDLHERNLSSAKEHFTAALRLAETSLDLIATAISSRALGEIDFMMSEDKSAATRYFLQARDSFEKMGTRPETILNHGWVTWGLGADFNGWKWSQALAISNNSN